MVQSLRRITHISADKKLWVKAFLLVVLVMCSALGALEAQPANSSSSDMLQLHMAEYNALTSRNTYLMTLQYQLLAALLVFLPLVYLLLKRNIRTNKIAVWGGLIGILGLGIFWAQDLYELFNNVKYIEKYLRPIVDQVAPQKEFWCYEPYLVVGRVTRWGWLPQELIAFVFSPIMFLSVFCFRWHVNRHVLPLRVFRSGFKSALRIIWIDFVGAFISVLLVVGADMTVWNAVHARFDLTAAPCPSVLISR
jgi:hypothetical protein